MIFISATKKFTFPSANDRKPIRKILKHRELLARLAFSKMDCASQISKLLFEADKAKSITGNANFKK